ncbi:g6f-like isoform X2 [Leuresthes tenuis]|uniref:g6f-like isoform X2 n=1 Tax=Leuresthes tenuis TaxID=355514 RepID=UPI003B50BF49
MESAFLTFILGSSLVVYSSHTGMQGWDDVVVVEENTPATLGCTDTTMRGDISINWKKLRGKEWKLVLSASENNNFSGRTSKASMRLADSNFQDTGIFSLFFIPKMEDNGLYSCLIKKKEREAKEKIVLLAVLTVKMYPTAPVPQHSNLRLIAKVTPDYAITKITWTAPGGIPMKSEKKTNSGTVAKLPQVQNSDGGVYICTVYPWGNSTSVFATNMEVTVDADKVASFSNTTHGPMISTAIPAQTSFLLNCPRFPGFQGDYVLLFWLPPDVRKRSNMKLVHQYDRWRGSTIQSEQSKRLQLAGPPYNAEAGSFSFLLTPELRDGGIYSCEVCLNDNFFSQRTTLSVLKVITKRYPSKLELLCQYSERSQVQSAEWKHRSQSHKLKMSSVSPGSISVILPLPITSNVTGIYTCTLQLKNGQVIWADQAVTLPPKGGSSCIPSQLPSLSALLLLVPLVAAAVAVLLWRQKHISDRGIEQSLSVHSGETENIYENPEDIRQAPPQGSVYMVSYCVSSCTQTFCICVCMRSCNTHIHQCIQSLVFSFASSLSCQQICLPSHLQSSHPIYQPSLR